MENGLLNISSGAMCELQSNLSRFSSCTGLLGRQNNKINAIHLMKREPFKGPDLQRINGIISKVWLPESIEFTGIAIAHSRGLYRLTYDDVSFCKALFAGERLLDSAAHYYVLLFVQATAGINNYHVIPFCAYMRNKEVKLSPARLLINGLLHIPSIPKQYDTLDYGL